MTEAEAMESSWYRKNLGLLPDTLREQLKQRGLDPTGSKNILAIRLAQHQIGTIRASQ